MEEDRDPFVNFQEILRLKRYAPKTIASYGYMLKLYRDELKVVNINHFDYQRTIRAIITINEEKKFSRSSQKQLIGAVTLFYKEILHQNINLSAIYPTRKKHFIPQILAKEEVKNIIVKTKNLKHKTMLMTCYGLGLRRSEVLDLRINDIDGGRRLVHIKNAKGNKDRIVPISEKLLVLLREYYSAYKPRGYLFYGIKHDRYSETSFRNVFTQACKRANIRKNVTIHSLRHAYATHLMDNGTDIRLIQELLGHNSIKTTMQYTHVTTRSIQNVRNPLDDWG